MIKFIIYEDDSEIVKNYINIINKYMLKKNVNYKILVFNKYEKAINNIIINNCDGKRIYLLDVEVPGMTGIELAREIRSTGDWSSQIIILTAYEKKDYYLLTNRLLMLSFILKSKLDKDLILSLDTIWKIFFNEKVLSFKYNSEVYNIFYNDIFYIEKNIHNNNSTIYTGNGKYIIRSSIKKLMETLNYDSRFFNSHRSCIINLDNVCEYDINTNVVKFKNRDINLVSRDKKKEFRNRLLENNNIN